MKGYEVYRKERAENDKVYGFAVIKGMKKIVAELDLVIDGGMAAVQSIYVKEDERRKGVGTLLLQSVINTLDGMALFTPLEIRFVDEEESEGFQAFLRAQGNFTFEESAEIYSVSGADRKKLKKWQQMAMVDTEAVEFYGLDKGIRDSFFKELAEQGYGEFVDPEGNGYDKRMSFAKVKDGKIKGAVFMIVHDEKVVEVAFLYTGENKPKTVQSVLCAAINAVDELYPKADLRFVTVTPEGSGVARGIFGDEAETKRLICARWTGLSQNVLGAMDEFPEDPAV